MNRAAERIAARRLADEQARRAMEDRVLAHVAGLHEDDHSPEAAQARETAASIAEHRPARSRWAGTGRSPFTLVVAGLVVAGLADPRAVVAGLLPMAYVLFTTAADRPPRTAFTVLAVALATTKTRHDIVAHGMSVITVQAGFATLIVDDRPDEARAALGAIESTGREALTEMRRLLGVLRDPDGTGPELAPVPGLAGLDRLAEQTAKAGVRVDLTVTGRPRALPQGVGLSAYRIVQEALTNVVKHAATDSVRAALDYREDELAPEIIDAGRGCPDPEPRPGHGPAGMRERVHLYGTNMSTRRSAAEPAASC